MLILGVAENLIPAAIFAILMFVGLALFFSAGDSQKQYEDILQSAKHGNFLVADCYAAGKVYRHDDEKKKKGFRKTVPCGYLKIRFDRDDLVFEPAISCCWCMLNMNPEANITLGRTS